MILDRAQGSAVHDFQSFGAGGAQRKNGVGRRIQVRIQQESRVLYREIGNRIQNGFRDKGQGALGSDQHVLENVEGGVEIEERVQRIAGCVLALVLVADTFAQIGILFQLLFQIQNTAGQLRFAGAKFGVSIGLRGVDDCARRKHELHGPECVISILLDAAAHAAGVVGKNAAHGAGCDRRRIRPDLRAIGCECRVGAGADHSWLHSNLLASVFDLDLSPVARNVYQQAVGDRLSRQARAGCAKRHRYSLALAECK